MNPLSEQGVQSIELQPGMRLCFAADLSLTPYGLFGLAMFASATFSGARVLVQDFLPGLDAAFNAHRSLAELAEPTQLQEDWQAIALLLDDGLIQADVAWQVHTDAAQAEFSRAGLPEDEAIIVLTQQWGAGLSSLS